MYNFKPEPVQRMLDFDYMCGKDIKDASLAGLITPGSSRGNHKVRCALPPPPTRAGLLRDRREAHPRVRHRGGGVPGAPRRRRLHQLRLVPQVRGVEMRLGAPLTPRRSAFQSSMEALEQPSIRTVAIIAEG